MEISDKNPVGINPYVKQIQQNESSARPDRQRDRAVSREDNVELSRTAGELKRAQKALEDVPDIRQEKIERIKNRIENGTYEIKPDKIADKMLKESLKNDLF